MNSESAGGLRMAMRLLLMLLVGACASLVAGAAEDEFLPPEQVFKHVLSSDGAQRSVHWSLPKGYYAYKSRMAVQSATSGLTVADPVYPKGEVHNDDFFGAQEVYRGDFVVSAPLTLAAGAPRNVLLKLKIQGCADAGLCYPPQLYEAKLDVPAAAAARPRRYRFDPGRASPGARDAEFLPRR